MRDTNLEELRLISKLQKKGIGISPNEDLHDWKNGIVTFNYGGRDIRVKIIISDKMIYDFEENPDFNYIIVATPLNYCIIPKELMGNVEYPKKTFEKLKDSANLIKVSNKIGLLSEINEMGVRFNEICRTGVFFDKIEQGIGKMTKKIPNSSNFEQNSLKII